MSAIRTAIEEAYAARAANDAQRALKIFAPDAVYRVMGDGAYSVLAGVHAADAIGAAFEQLLSAFATIRFVHGPIIVEGDRAAATVEAELRFTPTGEIVRTSFGHFWTFRDGKAVEFLEFCDTAHAHALLMKAAAR